MKVKVEIPGNLNNIFKDGKFKEYLTKINADLRTYQDETLSGFTERAFLEKLVEMLETAELIGEELEPQKAVSNYGTFKVETRYLCDGAFQKKKIGTYTGYIDDIAFALADTNNEFIFTPVATRQLPVKTPKKKEVHIILNGVEELMAGKNAYSFFTDFFADRDVTVARTNSDKHCTLVTNKETVEEKKAKALEKLTAEEKELLGLL